MAICMLRYPRSLHTEAQRLMDYFRIRPASVLRIFKVVDPCFVCHHVFRVSPLTHCFTWEGNLLQTVAA